MACARASSHGGRRRRAGGQTDAPFSAASRSSTWFWVTCSYTLTRSCTTHRFAPASGAQSQGSSDASITCHRAPRHAAQHDWANGAVANSNPNPNPNPNPNGVRRQTRDLHQRHERARRRVGGGCEESSRMQGPWRSPPWRAVPAARTPCVRLLRPRRRERARGSASFFRGYSRATVPGLDLGGIPALQVLQNKNNEPTHTLYAADRGQHCKFPVKFLVVDSGGLSYPKASQRRVRRFAPAAPPARRRRSVH